MPEIVQEKESIRLMTDDDGFLSDPGSWNETAARMLAAREGITDLSEDQFDILRSLRAYYGKHAFFPIPRSVCRSIDQPRNCISNRFSDPVTAWKIAGLPNPGEQVVRFRSWEPLGY